MTLIALSGAAVIAGAVFVQAVHGVIRRRQILKLAARYGLINPENGVLARLPVPVLDAEARAVAHGISGAYRGKEIAIFDLWTGYGRHKTAQTVIAVTGRLRVNGRHCTGRMSCEFQEMNGWVMAFRPGELLTAGGIESLLMFLLDTA